AMFQLVLILGLCSLSTCLARQYHFVNESKTWAEAQRYCREHYVDLASIDNSEDTRAIKNIEGIKNSRSTWIGLYDDLNSWRWSLDNDNFYKGNERNFRNWYIQKPQSWGGDSNCVYFYSYEASWWTTSCSSTLPFICYDGRENASTRHVLVNQYKTWTEAQSYCREYYTDLASVRNDTENQKLRSLTSDSYYSAWIGLYRTRSWSDQSNSSFSYWKSGQPDNAGQREYCTAVSFSDSGQWTDENCIHTLPFLCYSAVSPTFPHQYHFVNESKSWTEAQRYCRENYTDLATIDNMDEMNRLINTVNSSYSGLAWIGLYKDLYGWRWSLDDHSYYKEEERDFRGWRHQPDNYYGEELCVYMQSDGRWYDENCQSGFTFICYDDINETHPYIWINQYRSWADAQRYCRQLYTDLASVRSLTENQRILNITGGSDVWIGLYRTRLWSDQHSSTYENWRPEIPYSPEQPDNGQYLFRESGNQHCTAVSLSDSGLWTDENCLTTLPFVCYSKFCTGMSCGPHQYHFVNESKSWTEAQRYCRENYTDLATIDNMEEMNRLINTVNSSYSGLAWIGLYDDLDSWRWSLDDESFYKENVTTFSNWYTEKPINIGGNSMCVLLSVFYATWRENICSYQHPFICYDERANASARYVLVEQRMNWTEAQKYCRERHTDLTSVRNETENRKLQSLFNISTTAWIGLYRTRSWSDQSNSSFNYWKAGQPDNDRVSEHCTAASFSDSGKWRDEHCDQAFPFFCYSAMTSRQYHFITESKSWTEAQRYCREHYTDLATIDNMEEMNRLINTVNSSYSGLAWIGLYDDLDSWRWSLDDDKFYKEGERDFRGWRHDPDNADGKELCVCLSFTGEWVDAPCADGLGFVCYNSGVVGLRVKVKDERNRSASQIEGWLVMQLQDELIRLGLPSNFTLKVTNLRKTTP
ncbi:hypothetical protein NFI96_014382, partial [Prochilodus magdalenae]